jgi:transglutaminase-like putative cysteine protease
MRIRIRHETTYRYSVPARSAIQVLRMTPRDHQGQFVSRWDVRTDGDGRVVQRKDWFGNITHGVTLDGPISEIVLTAAGEVETEDAAGVVRGTVEHFPPGLFLRDTALTRMDGDLIGFANTVSAGEAGRLGQLHALMCALNERLRFDTDATLVTTTAGEAFAAGHGVCQDFSHIFLAVARHLGIPARYVSGYLYNPEREEQEAGHAWCEAYVPDIGWIAFDPTNGVCATDRYVRVAIGLDYVDCAPVKGSRHGAGNEVMSVRLKIGSAPQRRS